MNAGPLHAGAVARRRRVVQSEQQMVAGRLTHQGQQDATQQAVGQRLRLSTGGPESAVGVEGVGGDASRPKPGGDRATAAGEQRSVEQEEEAWSRAAVEAADEQGEPGGQNS